MHWKQMHRKLMVEVGGRTIALHIKRLLREQAVAAGRDPDDDATAALMSQLAVAYAAGMVAGGQSHHDAIAGLAVAQGDVLPAAAVLDGIRLGLNGCEWARDALLEEARALMSLIATPNPAAVAAADAMLEALRGRT